MTAPLLVELFGGPLDGQRRHWPSSWPPPEIYFPLSPRITGVASLESQPLDYTPSMRVLVYRHRSLGAYDFHEERIK